MSAVTKETKSVTDYLTAIVWDGKDRIARWLYACAIRLDPGLHAEAFKPQDPSLHDDDPIVDVLHRALGSRTGKLRVSDAYLICGIEPGKANQDQISRFGRAIRELGWERQRCHFDGALQYAYVKGTTEQRKVELVVEYDPHMRSVRIEIDAPPPN
jgi:hypothetical protein